MMLDWLYGLPCVLRSPLRFLFWLRKVLISGVTHGLQTTCAHPLSPLCRFPTGSNPQRYTSGSPTTVPFLTSLRYQFVSPRTLFTLSRGPATQSPTDETKQPVILFYVPDRLRVAEPRSPVLKNSRPARASHFPRPERLNQIQFT